MASQWVSCEAGSAMAMATSAHNMASSGTSTASPRWAKYAPPNRAIAATGVKLYGSAPGLKYVTSRNATANAIMPVSTSRRGVNVRDVAGGIERMAGSIHMAIKSPYRILQTWRFGQALQTA